jgi:hypothetical protein
MTFECVAIDMAEDFSQPERQNIVASLVRWENELAVTGGKSVSDEEIRDSALSYYQESDGSLKNLWYNNVGEWVLSRRDINRPDDEPQQWLDSQFKKIKEGENPPWGYIQWLEIPTQAEIEEMNS